MLSASGDAAVTVVVPEVAVIWVGDRLTTAPAEDEMAGSDQVAYSLGFTVMPGVIAALLPCAALAVLGSGVDWTAGSIGDGRAAGLEADALSHAWPHTSSPDSAPRRRHHTGRTSTGRALLTPRVVGLATHDPQGVVVVGPGRHEEGKGKAPALGSGLRFRERQTPGIDSNRTLDHRLTV